MSRLVDITNSYRGFLFIGAATAMMLGYGLAFSFTAVYLTEVPHAGTNVVAAYFSSLGIAGILTGALMSTKIGKVSPRAACATAIVIAIAAFLALPHANDLLTIILCAAALGGSAAIFQATVVPLLQELTPPEHLPMAFAVRYQGSNLALAIGVSIAGVLVGQQGIAVMRALFIAAALAHIPLLILLALRPFWPPSHLRSVSDQQQTTPPVKVPGNTLARRLAPLMLFQAAAGLLVFPHLESTLPLIVDQVEQGPATWITAAVLANLSGVLLLQVPLVRLLRKRSAADGLYIAALMWAATHLIVLGLTVSQLFSPVVSLVAYGLLIAAGECAYSASFMPLLISAVPKELITQTSSIANTVVSIGTSVGPAVGAYLVGYRSVTFVWAALAIASLLLLPLASAVKRIPVNETSRD